MPPRIVFLCTGNTCRSPLAEVLAGERFGNLGLRFVSAGLDTVPDLPASTASADYAAARGLSLAAHRSQPVTPGLLADAAWCVGMTRSHAAIFRSRYGALFPGAIGILGAPGLDLGGTACPAAVEEVADPYGASYAGYAECGDQISRLIAAWSATFAALGP